MPLLIVRDNIVHMKVDAIVNAANEALHPGGGVCGSIFDTAGFDDMLAACRKIGGCKTGQAVITPGFALPAKYVIHAVGPRWNGGNCGEEEQLRSCYQVSLEIAKAQELESIAFPLISSGIYGYPKDKALRVAMAVISEFVLQNDMYVYLVMYDRQSFVLSEKLVEKVESYIDDCYVQSRESYRHLRAEESAILYPRQSEQSMGFNQNIPDNVEGSTLNSPNTMSKHIGTLGITSHPGKQKSSPKATQKAPESDAGSLKAVPPLQSIPHPSAQMASQQMSKEAQSDADLSDMLKHMDETFSESLLRRIDEKGKKDSEVYKRANVDRRLFSKIRANKNYKPTKQTAVAFCIALELPMEETDDLLARAGYVLTHTNEFDIIVEYYIKKHNYDIFELNEMLFQYDQPLLGSVSA